MKKKRLYAWVHENWLAKRSPYTAISVLDDEVFPSEKKANEWFQKRETQPEHYILTTIVQSYHLAVPLKDPLQ